MPKIGSDMFVTYEYRLCPTEQQEKLLQTHLDVLRELYNATLQERRDAYEKHGVSLSRFDQEKELVEVKRVRPDVAVVHAHVLYDVIARVDRAFQGFFRRCKAGKTPGYPRFKGRGRCRSFTFKEASRNVGIRLFSGQSQVRIHGIGRVRVRLHRTMDGRIKTATVKLALDGKWYVTFCCADVPHKLLPPTDRSVGIDLGISTFAAMSDGTMVANPRPFESAQSRLRAAQRCLSRRKKGSSRYKKQRAKVAAIHAKVARVRKDFHHKTAKMVVETYDEIAVEDLNVLGLARGRLSKQVLDAGWSQFLTILSNKAECAGRGFHRVDAKHTSQLCSGCGETVRKGLHVRVHDCPYCGLVIDRDINAARNIQGRGTAFVEGLQ